MILHRAQIQPDGHGECGLLPNPILFSNGAQLSFSGVLANIRINLAALLSLHHFKIGKYSMCQTLRPRNHFM